ncbi:MAG: hypothetical protein GWN99_11215 [Gemmatimonadetes bacterium]|nr:hypothetical protein [Gemmatimonadota bacterium]NIU52717.1 hypothetical protein [Gemmatimonadota bacterium]NIY43992.1 hypothetical protein [Gemmatimonadota bacterium]
MRVSLSAGILAALAAWTACATAPEPVPLAGGRLDIEALAGEWSGYYSSPAVDRTGSIFFSLEAGKDTAFGEVTMTPRGWTRPLRPADDPAADARDAPTPKILSISFVQVEGGKVSGTMDPYRDPDCGCAVYTTFTGTLKGDLIDGTFVSRPAHGAAYRGTWQVTRKKG